MKLHAWISAAAFVVMSVTFTYVMAQTIPQEPYFTLVTLGFIASALVFVWAFGKCNGLSEAQNRP